MAIDFIEINILWEVLDAIDVRSIDFLENRGVGC